MRGEDAKLPGFAAIIRGSPPHARGRQVVNDTTGEVSGITPACAGKTSTRRLAKLQTQDHPRMRGEDFELMQEQYDVEGITPACAGKTCNPLTGGSWSSGSPPHARGRRGGNLPRRLRAGITPACAGKTWQRSNAHASVRDHPRMRGEDVFGRNRARPRDGITPACAGKTSTSINGKPGTGDHPRMRGEDGDPRPEEPGGRGSPPHARGRLAGFDAELGPERITPACAGKTFEVPLNTKVR